MLNETIPVYLLGAYGPIVSVGSAIGYFLVLGFGIILPQADYNPELNENDANLAALVANKLD